jgi:hypothetical protein
VRETGVFADPLPCHLSLWIRHQYAWSKPVAYLDLNHLWGAFPAILSLRSAERLFYVSNAKADDGR